MQTNAFRKWAIGVAVAVGPAVVCYAGALLLEHGYASELRIPSNVVELSQAHVIRNTLALVVVCLFLGPLLDISTMFGWTRGETGAVTMRHIVTLVSAGLAIGAGVLLKAGFDTTAVSFLAFALSCLLGDIVYVRRHKQDPEGTELGRRLGIPGMAVVGSSMAILALIVTIGQLGKALARQQDDFMVLKDDPNRLVLRIYGDVAVTAPFDRSRHKILRERSLVMWREAKVLTMVPERLGRLEIE